MIKRMSAEMIKMLVKGVTEYNPSGSRSVSVQHVIRAANRLGNNEITASMVDSYIRLHFVYERCDVDTEGLSVYSHLVKKV